MGIYFALPLGDSPQRELQIRGLCAVFIFPRWFERLSVPWHGDATMRCRHRCERRRYPQVLEAFSFMRHVPCRTNDVGSASHTQSALQHSMLGLRGAFLHESCSRALPGPCRDDSAQLAELMSTVDFDWRLFLLRRPARRCICAPMASLARGSELGSIVALLNGEMRRQAVDATHALLALLNPSACIRGLSPVWAKSEFGFRCQPPTTTLFDGRTAPPRPIRPLPPHQADS